MLYFNPPYYVIDGISLLPDHEDPLQWYFMPVAPHFRTEADTSIEGNPEIPVVSLIKYRGDAGQGGIINFDVNLGVDQDLLDEIKLKLRNEADLDDTPRLAPLPVVDGSVKLVMLGQDSSIVAPEAEPVFKLTFANSSKPSLYGDNQAVFSAQLDPEATVIMEQALRGEVAPVGVIYTLEYVGLRPAYSVSIQADWSRVQTHMEEHFGVDSIFLSASIDEQVDKLIEDRVIVIEVDTFVPEGEDAKDLITRRDQAVDEIKDMVTETFFQASLEPPTREKPDNWDKAAEVAQRVSTLSATGGLGVCSFSYKKVDMTRIDKKKLNANIRERTAIKRSISPQAHLHGLFKVLRDNGIDAQRFIMSVDTDDDWYQRRRIKAISRADFENDRIESVNLTLKYGDDVKGLLFDEAHKEDEVAWSSIIENNLMIRGVEASYTVNFKGVENAERPLKLQSEPQVTASDIIEIQPRELYAINRVNIIALNFPWEAYPHVEVHVRYQDEENGIAMDDSFILTAGVTEAAWDVFVLNPETDTIDFRVIYRAADNKDIEMSWVSTDEDIIVVRDPYPSKRVLDVVPVVDWSEVDMVFVDLRYGDVANDLFEEESFQFMADDKKPKSFTVDLADTNKRTVQYKVQIVFKTGNLVEVPLSETQERRVMVLQNMKGHRVIQITTDGKDFADSNIKNIQVEISYSDAAAGIDVSDLFKFVKPSDVGVFEFDYVDADKTNYSYRLKYVLNNGLTKTIDATSSQEEVLIVPVSPG